MDFEGLGRLLWYQVLLPLAGYLALGIPFIVLEQFFPARPIAHRRRLLSDLLNCTIVFVNGVAVSWVVFGVIDTLRLRQHFLLVPELPLWASFPLALVAIDFTLYWLHRGIHTRWFWPLHRWHHGPTELYWLSGIRASLPQNALYVLVSLGWALALHIPTAFYGLGALGGALGNDFMHTNLRLRAPWLERVVITPRAHLLHHRKTLDDPHNYGAFLSVWDHLFGTWSDPERSPPVEQVGIDDPVHPLWQIAGL